MLCERCGKREATTHLRESINGAAREIHLCGECAHEMGYDHMFMNFNPFEEMAMDMQGILGGLFSQSLPAHSVEEGHKCSFCGTTFEELARTAKAGCANCYHEFYRELLPSIERIHGKTRHVGKIPGTAGRELKLRREIESLKKQLGEAVAAQEFEKAAQLRDQIKEREKKVQGE